MILPEDISGLTERELSALEALLFEDQDILEREYQAIPKSVFEVPLTEVHNHPAVAKALDHLRKRVDHQKQFIRVLEAKHKLKPPE
jgi:hypothetical protein